MSDRFQLRRWLAAAMALGVLGAATAAAAEVPAHWLAYARQAGETLQQRLADGSATVAELHGWMERSATRPQRQDPVVVKLWIDAGGAAEGFVFPPACSCPFASGQPQRGQKLTVPEA